MQHDTVGYNQLELIINAALSRHGERQASDQFHIRNHWRFSLETEITGITDQTHSR